MNIVLERHAYAPELNKAHIYKSGKQVRLNPEPYARNLNFVECPGLTTIKQIKKKLFSAVSGWHRVFTVKVFHTKELHKICDKTYVGTAKGSSLQEQLRTIKSNVLSRHELADMKFTISSKLVAF